MRTLFFLLRKEFLQIRRDPAILRMLIFVPIVQLLLLSSAATFTVRESKVYVVDEDHSSTSRGLLRHMTGSGLFQIAGASGSMERANEAMLDRDVSTIVHVPPNFERDLVRNRTASVQLTFNAEDGAAAGILRSYALRIITAYSAELAGELQPARAAAIARNAPVSGFPRIALHTRGWYNPTLDYRDYMVPGILVLLVTIVATTIGSMNVVREKEIGTLEQLNVTPVTRGQFIAAKLIPFWILALLELGFGLFLARLFFDIPMEGSLFLIFGAAMVYLLVSLGIGLWISTIAATQQQAMFVSFAVNMIYLLMSGLFTPIQSMPEWAQWIAQLSPVKHFIVIMRSVLMKGADLPDVALPIGGLALYGAVVLLLATRQYSKTVS